MNLRCAACDWCVGCDWCIRAPAWPSALLHLTHPPHLTHQSHPAAPTAPCRTCRTQPLFTAPFELIVFVGEQNVEARQRSVTAADIAL